MFQASVLRWGYNTVYDTVNKPYITMDDLPVFAVAQCFDASVSHVEQDFLSW